MPDSLKIQLYLKITFLTFNRYDTYKPLLSENIK